ncbi:hypothetical protein AA0472_1492 [Acetobacter estunensis NRIC 0472]|uniref:Uncharacterized protein n=1 Tax=Acetobacter estunensis TaxID=104097 RepID=A0A967EIE6_9PROT|nr:hypothetical protein [Acetobacter estunensis]NHO53079.1 hypothetical protein [Acetobacter estunensis]GBQ24648.1 hypothetical protein AA0472_1492 [Acetobacter estunensis NRIC 0472]
MQISPGFEFASHTRIEKRNRPVTVRDPSGRRNAFAEPMHGREVAIKTISGRTIEHVIMLENGVELTCPPTWVSAAPHMPVPSRAWHPYCITGGAVS